MFIFISFPDFEHVFRFILSKMLLRTPVKKIKENVYYYDYRSVMILILLLFTLRAIKFREKVVSSLNFVEQ